MLAAEKALLLTRKAKNEGRLSSAISARKPSAIPSGVTLAPGSDFTPYVSFSFNYVDVLCVYLVH